MKYERLKIGTRIFNGGDMANAEHFGTIIENTMTSDGKLVYLIQPEVTHDPCDREEAYWIHAYQFSETYSGNGSTRFVTEAAYLDWRSDRIKEFQARIAK